MDAAAFRALVERLEPGATARPALYRARVAALAVLGYGYVLGMLVLLTATSVVLVVAGRGLGVKAAIPLLVVVGAALRALWVQVSAPQGMALREADAPQLFALVRTLGRRLKAPRVHAVLVTSDLNAGVTQVPRLGVFGWYKNYLLIGLPLLRAVSPEEWQAILAHELGHLSGNHGRFGSWIYRLRATWSRLFEQFERRRTRLGMLVFGEFFGWFIPYFNAYTFVLARAHEYEADAAAAEVVGAETARRALARTRVAGHVVEHFWTGVRQSVAQTPEPPRDAHRQLGAALGAGAPPDDAAAWLRQAWTSPTDYADTHPALADRLRALGWPPAGVAPEPPGPPQPLDGLSAAQTYLGEAAERIERTLDEQWVREVNEAWRKRHGELAKAHERLTALDARPAGSLSPAEAWERVRLNAVLGEEERADQYAAALLERAPDYAPVQVYVGQRLLERGDPSGIAFVERGMSDPDLILHGCRMLFHFHWSRGEVAEAERYRERAIERQRNLREGEAERNRVTRDVRFAPHDLSAQQVTAVREVVARIPELEGGAVFLARRLVQYLPEQPCYVVGLAPKTPWLRPLNKKQEVELRHRVAQQLTGPVPLYVFLLTGKLKGLRRTLGRIEGARLL